MTDLSETITRGLHQLPPDIDVVVGVPRSGLLAGSMVALALNLPLADLDGFAEGRLLAAGGTRRRSAFDRPFETLRHALVVDDSIYSGKSMQKARQRLKGLPPSMKVTYLAIYGRRGADHHADIVMETVPEPRIYQWNVLHHDVLSSACVDLDGILCHDPSAAENDDGAAYLNFLATARPLHHATKRIGAIVTSRLEKYRAETEAWLAAHGVAYDELVMLDLPDAETRRRQGAHAPFKAEVYRRSDATIFIESEAAQAQRIADLSGKPVLCFATHTVFQPGAMSVAGKQEMARRNATRLRNFARRLVGRKARAGLKARLGLS